MGTHMISAFKLKCLICVVVSVFATSSTAQSLNEKGDSTAIVTNSFWDNWYVEGGIDMNLLNPHGLSFKDVFPNGKSFGINAAVGKWFTPEFGARLKLTWNNGILKNEHNTWLKPFGIAGENHRKGGFITFLGDIQLNLHNLFGDYDANRTWNLILAPRAGGWIDIGTGKGAHILGVGMVNTYRVSRNWSVTADVGYHFVSSINDLASGKGHGTNGFLEIGVGMQYDLGSRRELIYNNPKESFWKHWFAQAGLGMSLITPYSAKFSDVFPNGKTLGINIGIGKWFTPQAGLRVGLNWQNGIIVNKHASYLDAKDGSMRNSDKHGYIVLYGDLFLNLHTIISGYDASRKWNAIIFPRMGIVTNFSSTYKECPILGLGTEQTYQLTDRMKLFADVAYQVTTGGFLDAKFATGNEGAGSNGWFDINLGVQFELGKSKGSWRKVYE